MKMLQEANDHMKSLVERKEKLEAFRHPQPGRNVKRRFENSVHDANISPVDFNL